MPYTKAVTVGQHGMDGTFRWNIQALRERLGETRHAFAQQTGIDAAGLLRLEQNPHHRAGSITTLVRVYRYVWWRCQALNGTPVSLHDILSIEPSPPASLVFEWKPPHPRLVACSPGVWWNTSQLRRELSVQKGETISVQAMASAMRTTAMTIHRVEQGKTVGSVTTLLNAYLCFYEQLRRPVSLHDVLIVLPHSPQVN